MVVLVVAGPGSRWLMVVYLVRTWRSPLVMAYAVNWSPRSSSRLVRVTAFSYAIMRVPSIGVLVLRHDDSGPQSEESSSIYDMWLTNRNPSKHFVAQLSWLMLARTK